jgi:GPH family glycoside/pentoside/hexuronide:cation symporter
MVLDAFDYQVCNTGTRNEGSVYATYSMLRKVAQGFGQSFIPAAIAILIPTLDVKDALTWTAENSLAIRDMAALFPLIGYILIFICFKFIFNLDRKTVREMQVALGRDEE